MEADAARVLLKEARLRLLLSADHFTVYGTLLEAWASHKSYRPCDEQPPDDGRRGGRKRVEEVFGWIKTVGAGGKLRYLGRARNKL